MDTLALLGSLAAFLVCGTLLTLSWRHDPRQLRNGLLGVLTAYALVALLGEVVLAFDGEHAIAQVVEVVFWTLVAIGLLALPAFLVLNGLTSRRMAQPALRDRLSLPLGIVAATLLGVALWLATLRQTWSVVVAGLLLVVIGFFGIFFLGFAVQAIVYPRRARRAPGNAVIVLGSRLVDDRVPPLLADRLLEAITVARRIGGPDAPALLVPSGARGPGGPSPEGVAMGAWLRANGIHDEGVLVEDRATTTEENLRFSLDLLERAGIPGPYVVVTSSYHVPRAALLAVDHRVDAQVVGGRTPSYLRPSNYLREFTLLLNRRPLVTVAAGAVAVAVTLIALRVLTM